MSDLRDAIQKFGKGEVVARDVVGLLERGTTSRRVLDPVESLKDDPEGEFPREGTWEEVDDALQKGEIAYSQYALLYEELK